MKPDPTRRSPGDAPVESDDFQYVDDPRLKAWLPHIRQGDPVDGSEAQSFIRDLIFTLEEDRGERAREVSGREGVDRLALKAINDAEQAYTALSSAHDEISEERDALLDQVVALQRTGPVQLIFKVEGDVHVTSTSGGLVLESAPDGDGDGDPGEDGGPRKA